MAARGRILLIDDEPSLLLTYSLILQRQGFEVVPARTLEEARAAMQPDSFRAIVCDLNIQSEGGGLPFLVDAQRTMPRAKSILLTGFATPEQCDEAERNSIVLLLKPTNLEE